MAGVTVSSTQPNYNREGIALNQAKLHNNKAMNQQQQNVDSKSQSNNHGSENMHFNYRGPHRFFHNSMNNDINKQVRFISLFSKHYNSSTNSILVLQCK